MRLLRVFGLPLFPFLAGLAYLVFSGASYWIEASELVRPALILVAVQAAVLLVLSRFTTAVRAGLMVLGVTLLLMPFAGTLPALGLVVFGALFLFILRRFGHPLRTGRALGGVLNLATAAMLGAVVFYGLNAGRIEREPVPNAALDCPAELRTDGPNIYVFLLDAHAREDTLQDMYAYDEEPWLKQLEGEGFTVDRNSHSNYAHTEWTIASMLNFAPISEQPAISADLAAGRRYYLPSVRDAMKHSRADQILRCAGYETVATDMPMSEFALSSSDRYLGHGEINQYEIHLLQNTRLMSLVDLVAPGWLDGQHRERLEAAMDDTAALAAEPRGRPRFTWVHMLSPHMPPVWSGDGAYPIRPTSLTFNYYADNADERGETAEEYITGYRAQLDHLHARLLATAKAIVAADPGAVIVFFSDHGAGSHLHNDDLTSSNLPERFGNLLAVRTPGRPGVFAGSPITPLMILPRLFNAYLGTTLDEPVDADKTWFGPIAGSDGSMQLVPVTPWPSPDASAQP